MKEKRNTVVILARTISILYFVITVLAPFSMLYVPSVLVIPNDAAATFRNITASEGLFRAGIACDALVFLIEIVITVLLYVLLKPVSKSGSLIAAFSRLAMTIVQGINLINYIFVLLLISGANYLSVFDAGQIQALVMLFLTAHGQVAFIWGLFFGLHLLALGYLVYRSGYIPRLVGVALLITSVCYLAQGYGNILLPQYKVVIDSMAMVAIIELVFPLWLLIKGIDTKVWEKRALESV